MNKRDPVFGQVAAQYADRILLPGELKNPPNIKQSNRHRLIVATKGDLLDQQRKLQRSGLASYFDYVEIMPDKPKKNMLS